MSGIQWRLKTEVSYEYCFCYRCCCHHNRGGIQGPSGIIFTQPAPLPGDKTEAQIKKAAVPMAIHQVGGSPGTRLTSQLLEPMRQFLPVSICDKITENRRASTAAQAAWAPHFVTSFNQHTCEPHALGIAYVPGPLHGAQLHPAVFSHLKPPRTIESPGKTEGIPQTSRM